MTGPLDLFTTSRSGDIEVESTLGAADSFAAWAARVSRVQTDPVITAAAPMTALRMMNDRRSMFSGSDDVSGNSGTNLLGFSGCFMVFRILWIVLRFLGSKG